MSQTISVFFMYALGKRSLRRLTDVHPDLIAVVKRAIQLSPYDFGVTEGVRTIETQTQYVADGKSTTLNSMHLPQDDVLVMQLTSMLLLTVVLRGSINT